MDINRNEDISKEEFEIFEPYINKEILCIKSDLRYELTLNPSLKRINWQIEEGKFYRLRYNFEFNGYNAHPENSISIGSYKHKCYYDMDEFYEYFRLITEAEHKVEIRQRKIKSILS